MRKLTTKLLVSILSVTLALAALGTSTFAWFTLGDSATVSSIEAQVKAQEGIEISLDYDPQNSTAAATWTNSVDAPNFDGRLKDLANVAAASNQLTLKTNANQNAVAGTDFYELKFYVRGLGAAQTKTLKAHVILTSANMDPWTHDVNIADVDDNDTPDNDTDDVTTTYMYVGDTFTPNAGQAARVTLLCGSTYNTFADTTNKYTDSATHVNATTDAIVTKEENLAKKYADAKNFQTLTWSDDCIEDSNDIVNFTSDPVSPVKADVQGDVVMGSSILEITVSIWLNGWDDQCINAILGGQISVDIVLTLAD